MEDIYSLILAAIILILFVALFIFLAGRIKRKGHSMQTIFYGATDELLTSDQKHAIEYVMEQKAGKKMFEQKSGDPDSKDPDTPDSNSN